MVGGEPIAVTAPEPAWISPRQASAKMQPKTKAKAAGPPGTGSNRGRGVNVAADRYSRSYTSIATLPVACRFSLLVKPNKTALH